MPFLWLAIQIVDSVADRIRCFADRVSSCACRLVHYAFSRQLIIAGRLPYTLH